MSTLILKDEDSPLSKKYLDDPTAFLDVVIRECDDSIFDEQDVVLMILNNDEIENEIKKEYITKLKTKISSLHLVGDNSIWSAIIENGCVNCSEETISEYYDFSGQIDEYLVKFINDSSELPDFSTLDDENDDLFQAFAKCVELNNDKYERVILSFGWKFVDFEIDGITDEKMMILINRDIISLNKETLISMRAIYPGVLAPFIEHNIDDYISLIDDSLFSKDELLHVLSSGVNDKRKIALLKRTTDPVSIKNRKYSIRIKEYILTNNLDRKDFPYLFGYYSKFENRIKTIVLSLAFDNLDYILSHADEVDLELCDEIIQTQRISNQKRVEILIAIFDRISKEDAERFLYQVGKGEFNKIFDLSTRPVFEYNTQNETILQAFKENKWIRDYTVKNGKMRILRYHNRERERKVV
jgi:hypothetical protein